MQYNLLYSTASNWFVTLYYVIASPQWARPQNMAIGDLAFYYTLYISMQPTITI